MIGIRPYPWTLLRYFGPHSTELEPYRLLKYSEAYNHSRRRPSIPTGRGKFQPPPHKINTPEPIDKKIGTLITSARGPPIPNLVEIHSLGASGQMGEM